MEYEISWGGEPEDVCMTPRGVASLVDLDAMFAEAVADQRWVEGMNVLLDYTRVDMTGLSADEMKARADRLTEMVETIGKQRIALVAASPGNYKTMRMIAYLLDGNVGFEASMFTSLVDAREWLRDPSTVDLPHILPKP